MIKNYGEKLNVGDDHRSNAWGGGLRMRQCCSTIENKPHLVNKSTAIWSSESERSASKET